MQSSEYTISQECTSSLILEKRRQLAEVHDALEAQKDEFARKMDAFRRREESLHKKDLRLQDSLIKFNKFLQENEKKRTRAMKRCSDECRIRELKEEEIVKLKDLLKVKDEEERELSEKLSRGKKYPDYLKSVIQQEVAQQMPSSSSSSSSDDYSEIQDILDRYQTLKTTNDDLLAQLEKNTKHHETSRLNYTQFTKKSSNEILNMNNEIVMLQKEMDQLNVRSKNNGGQHGSTNLEDGRMTQTDLTADLSQIFVVVNQMLERFESLRAKNQKCKVSSSSHNNKNNDSQGSNDGGYGVDGESVGEKTKRSVEQLEKISDYMTDYKSIADEWESNNNNSPSHQC